MAVSNDVEPPVGFEDLRGRELQGRYRIDELVHASPWRMSFAGREHETERSIVVEVVRPSRLHDHATVERFERRISDWELVQHPVIHGPIASGELPDGKLYVVSERPSGEPLDLYLQRQPSGRLVWRDARLLLLELVRGLGAAHGLEIVHGSLSPSCCWVDRSDLGVLTLRVLGVGTSTSPAAGDTAHAGSGTTALAHDAVFIAPETAGLILGDERSDVYLTGLIAWFMLVGRPPFHAPTPLQLAAMHMAAPVPSVCEVGGAEVPVSIEELVRSMLAKKPEQRIAGMTEIEQALLAEGEGTKGRRGRTRARRAGAFSRREEAIQRLADARWGMEPRRRAPAPQAMLPVYPEPWETPQSLHVQDMADLIALGSHEGTITGFDGGVPAMPSFAHLAEPVAEAVQVLEVQTSGNAETMQLHTFSLEQVEMLRVAYEARLRDGEG